MNIYQTALHYLSRYASSEENLRRVLRRKHRRHQLRERSKHPDWEPDPDDTESIEPAIEHAVRKLKSFGFLDDTSYAATAARTMRARGQSIRAIRAKLASKGVREDAISGILSQEDAEDRELTAAHAYAKRRRLGPYRAGQTDDDRHRRDLAALCRAGYSYDVASAVLGRQR